MGGALVIFAHKARECRATVCLYQRRQAWECGSPEEPHLPAAGLQVVEAHSLRLRFGVVLQYLTDLFLACRPAIPRLRLSLTIRYHRADQQAHPKPNGLAGG